MEPSAIYREPALDASPVLLAVEWRPPVLELRIDLVPLEWEPAGLPVLRVEATGPDIPPEAVETLRGGVGRTCIDGTGWFEPRSTPELLLYLDFRADPLEIRASGIREELEAYTDSDREVKFAHLRLVAAAHLKEEWTTSEVLRDLRNRLGRILHRGIDRSSKKLGAFSVSDPARAHGFEGKLAAYREVLEELESRPTPDAPQA
jgi:hypothetical protein